VNQDAKLIFEAYNKRLNEGLFDRAKATAAGMGGAIKGAGSRLAAGAQGAVAGLTGNVAAAQAAGQKGAAAKQMAQDAKVQSIVNSHSQKIKKAINDYTGDLVKLKVMEPKAATDLTNQFTQSALSYANATRAAGTPTASSNASSNDPSTWLTSPAFKPAATSVPTAAANRASPIKRSKVLPRIRPSAATPAPSAPAPTTPTTPAQQPPASAETSENPENQRINYNPLANDNKIPKEVVDKVRAANRARPIKRSKGLPPAGTSVTTPATAPAGATPVASAPDKSPAPAASASASPEDKVQQVRDAALGKSTAGANYEKDLKQLINAAKYVAGKYYADKGQPGKGSVQDGAELLKAEKDLSAYDKPLEDLKQQVLKNTGLNMDELSQILAEPEVQKKLGESVNSFKNYFIF
jgi:hypothetical protein